MVQMRKIVRELYPEQFDGGRDGSRAPRKGFLRRFAGRKVEPAAARTRPGRRRKQVVFASAIGAVLLYLWALMYYYNVFVTMESDVSAARSQIGVQLQRRKDVVASLNTVVMAYAKHEKAIFEHAVDARKEIMRPAPAAPAKEAPTAAPRLPIPGLGADSALSKLLAVAEAFPALRLSENFQRLMDALVESETKIAEQRMKFNSRCNDMSTALHTFPARIFNLVLRFKSPDFYTVDDDVQERVKLDLKP